MVNTVAFLSYVIISTFTPGPNNIMSMSIAHKYGYRKSLPFSAGVAAGFIIVISLCIYFNLLLYNNIPRIRIYMAILGAVYMLYLAYKTILDKPHAGKGRKVGASCEPAGKERGSCEPDSIVDSGRNTGGEEGKDRGKGRPAGFFAAALLQFINPKLILYGITTVSNFVMPYYKTTAAFILIAVSLAMLASLSTTCWALLGAVFQKLLSKYETAFKIVMGLSLVYCAVSILLE